MKRIISVLLALIMTSPIISYQIPSADALGAIWIKEFSKDKFGDPTDQYYLTNETTFKGTYNSASESDSLLGASLIFEREDNTFLAYVVLYLNGTEQLKNSSSSDKEYNIYVKKTDGSQFTSSGLMQAGKRTIELLNAIEMIDALSAPSGEVKIYIEEAYQENNNYLFAAECGNFKELYDQEILNPYLEEQYQKATDLLEQNEYDEAAALFYEIREYKDSAEHAEMALMEGQYQKATDLLEQKKYDAAAALFDKIRDYKDSAARAELALEEKRLEPTYYLAEIDSFKKAGNIVTFGTYEQDNVTSNGGEPIEWIVLAVKDDKSLLISRYALDCKMYMNGNVSEVKEENRNWEHSDLRIWLNSTFLNAAFSDYEMNAILNTLLDDCGVTDRIFLLSYSEVASFFKSDDDRICKATDYAIANHAFVDRYKTGGCWWWLRSLGNYFSAKSVNIDGSLKLEPSFNHAGVAVRPALWVDLTSLIS